MKITPGSKRKLFIEYERNCELKMYEFVRKEKLNYIPPGLSVYIIQNLVLINERLSGGNCLLFKFYLTGTCRSSGTSVVLRSSNI